MFDQCRILGTIRATEKRSIRYPIETYIVINASTVRRKATILVTVSNTLIPSLKTMQNHSEICNRKIYTNKPSDR